MSNTSQSMVAQFVKANPSVGATQGQIRDLWREINSYETSGLTFLTGLTNTNGVITNNLSTGVLGGQSVIGGTATGNPLTLSSNPSNDGKINFGGAGLSYFDEATGNLLLVGTIKTAAPSVNGAGAWSLGKVKTGVTVTGALPDQYVEITIDGGLVIPIAIAQTS